MWVFILGIGITLIAAVLGAIVKRAGERYKNYGEMDLRKLRKRKLRIAVASFLLIFMLPIILGFIFFLMDFRLNDFVTVLLGLFVVSGSLVGTTAAINYFQAKGQLAKENPEKNASM